MRRILPLLGLLLAATAAGGSSIPDSVSPLVPAAAGASQRIVHEGVAVQLDLERLGSPAHAGLREGDDVAFRFSITDSSGQALSGLYPAAWMDLREGGSIGDEDLCERRIEEFVAGSILTRPELDLNVYYVLALNEDPTISVVDPLFGYGGTQLLAMVNLPGRGEDWVLTPDGHHVWVTVPDSDRLVAVDTSDWRVVHQVEVSPRPADLALQPDGAYLWAGLESDDPAKAPGVAVIDSRSRQLVARIPTGAGRHEIAFSADSRHAFVTNSAADSVSIIDVRRLAKVRDLPTGERPASVAFSRLAGAAYVTHAGDGTIVAIDGERGEVVARIESRPGLGQIRFAPGERLGFAVNPALDSIEILDSARNRIVQTGRMLDQPDQVIFSDDLAYVRHLGSETVLMIPLSEIGEPGADVPVVDFPGGQAPFGLAAQPSRAPAIVRAPGAVAVLVANPADQAIYYYKEGMAAPMGAFQNYKRHPRAVLAVDRSLRERGEPGVYATAAKLRRPGTYAVSFLLDTPRIVHCFPIEVAADPVLEAERLAARPVVVEHLEGDRPAAAGEGYAVRFRVTDPDGGDPATGLGDVHILAYSTDNWRQQRLAAETAPGVYGTELEFPRPGTYYVVVETAAGRLRFQGSPKTVVRVGAGASASGRPAGQR